MRKNYRHFWQVRVGIWASATDHGRYGGDHPSEEAARESMNFELPKDAEDFIVEAAKIWECEAWEEDGWQVQRERQV